MKNNLKDNLVAILILVYIGLGIIYGALRFYYGVLK